MTTQGPSRRTQRTDWTARRFNTQRRPVSVQLHAIMAAEFPPVLRAAVETNSLITTSLSAESSLSSTFGDDVHHET